jgi:hypothetical protein
MKLFSTLSTAIILLSTSLSPAQEKGKLTKADKSALENIIVEKYYVSTESDASDTTGGILPKGSITYRIYVDLKPNYTLQAVFGVPSHELFIKTTTEFFNNKLEGKETGDKIDDKKINENTVALDSWVSMAGATKYHFGVPKSDDNNGSLITKKSLDKADGLIVGNVPAVAYFGLDLSFFNTPKANTFLTNNGSWATFGGIKGPTPDNKILIAQLTTDGKLSFELNIQIGTPNGATQQYVAKDPQGNEIKFKGLTYNK